MRASVERPYLSIVTTLYRSAAYLEEFLRRTVAAALQLTDDFEIILVNDGSPDDSLSLALEHQSRDPRIIVIDLSRNFGHHRAIMTGLAFARGERIFLVDCDLEEEPEWLLEFHTTLRVKNVDVVYGVQSERKGGWFERWSGSLFYRLINFLSGMQMPRNVVIARLMTRRYVRSLLRHREQEFFVAGLFYLTGYTQYGVTVKKHGKGETTYTVGKKLNMLVNAVTSVSSRPLAYIFNVGAIISLLSGCFVFYLLLAKILFGVSVSGWTSLIVSVWFLGGLTILFLGVIGIYLSRVFIETKRRPYVLVRQIHRPTRVVEPKATEVTHTKQQQS